MIIYQKRTHQMSVLEELRPNYRVIEQHASIGSHHGGYTGDIVGETLDIADDFDRTPSGQLMVLGRP